MKCPKCVIDKPEIDFIKEGKLYTLCINCRSKAILLYQNNKLGIIPPKIDLKNKRKIALLKGNYVCSKCKTEKLISNFSTNTNSSKEFGLGGQCKACLKSTCKFSKIKVAYNLSKQDFLKIYEEQKGKCKICNITMETLSFANNKATTLCIDHNHDTGKIRGFLCNNCNRAIGLLKDNKDTILSAYNYLVHNKQEELLENPTLERQKEDNQQPSLLSNEFEGSTTNTQILSVNTEDSNGNTSILQLIK